MITVKEHIIRSMTAVAAAAWPEECCGLLLGERSGRGDLVVSEIMLSDNCASDKTSGFLIDPSMHMELQRRVRGTASEICGLFHSHPTGCSEPSLQDQQALADHAWIWFIVGADETKITNVKAFRRAERGAALKPIEYRVDKHANAA